MNIASPYSSVTLNGSIVAAGSVSITAGGSIAASGSSVMIGAPPRAVDSTGALVQATIPTQITLSAGGDIGSAIAPIAVRLAGTAEDYVTATSTQGSVYLQAPSDYVTLSTGLTRVGGVLPIGEILAGNGGTASLGAGGSIVNALSVSGAPSGSVNVAGGVVSLISLYGGIGPSAAPLLLHVGQANNNQLTVTAAGGVYLTQPTGDLRLYGLTTIGDVSIDVEAGSLIDANTGVEQDPRPVSEQNPASSAFSLTDVAGGQLAALKSYQLSQQQLYATYWSELNSAITTNSLTVSSSGAGVALPAGQTIVVRNTGSEDAYFALGDANFSATTADTLLKAGKSVTITAGANAYLAAIEDSRQLAVASTSASVALPSAKTIVVSNTGAADAYVRLGGAGVSATTADALVKAGASATFAVGADAYLAAIETGGSTTLSISPAATTLSVSNTISDLFAESGDLAALSRDFALPIDPSYTATYTKQGEAKGLSGQALTDYVSASIAALKSSQMAAFYNLLTIFGPGGSYAAGTKNLYDPSTSTVTGTGTNETLNLVKVSSATYSPTAFDTKFVYLLTQSEVDNVEAGVHAWTQSQLDNGVNVGLLSTSTGGGSTETAIITGATITINAGGDIGSLVDPVAAYNSGPDRIGYQPTTNGKPTNIDGTPVQQALATAAQSDLNYLAATPEEVTVNFSGATMTRTGSFANTAWDTSVYHVGDWLYIGGLTKNATSNGAYLEIASIDGAVITFATSVASEIGQKILVAPVVTTETVTTTRAESVAVTVSGDTMTRSVGVWDAINYAPGNLVSIDGVTSDRHYLEVASVSGATVTFTTEPNASAGTFTFAPVVVTGGLEPVDESYLVNADGTPLPLGTTPPSQKLFFGNQGGAGTITLVDPAPGVTWASLGYKVHGGIWVDADPNNADPAQRDPNGNGTNFDPAVSQANRNYYTIAAINGNTITLDWGQTLTPEQETAPIAPVVIDIVKSGEAGAVRPRVAEPRHSDCGDGHGDGDGRRLRLPVHERAVRDRRGDGGLERETEGRRRPRERRGQDGRRAERHDQRHRRLRLAAVAERLDRLVRGADPDPHHGERRVPDRPGGRRHLYRGAARKHSGPAGAVALVHRNGVARRGVRLDLRRDAIDLPQDHRGRDRTLRGREHRPLARE